MLIYKLSDPFFPESVAYIGRTLRQRGLRVSQHLHEAKPREILPGRSPLESKSTWLGLLRALGEKPIIEYFEPDDFIDRDPCWNDATFLAASESAAIHQACHEGVWLVNKAAPEIFSAVLQRWPHLLNVNGRWRGMVDPYLEELWPAEQWPDWQLSAAIKRDHPEIAAAVERGEYPSMRQAAIAAGIVKPPDAYTTACRAWSKMIPEERDAFEDFIANWRRSHGEVA